MHSYMRKLLRSICILVGIFLLLGGNIVSANEHENPHRKVRVGYYLAAGFQDYDPTTNTYSGSSYEYMMALKQYTNWEFEFVPVEFSKGLVMLEKGELDLLNNVSRTPARMKTLLFSEASSGANYGVLAVSADNTTYPDNDFDSFKNMRVGARYNSNFLPYFYDFCTKNNFKPKELKFYPSTQAMSAAFHRGEIDTRIVSSSYHEDSRIVAKFAPMEYYFAVPKNAVSLMAELNKAMEQIKTDLPNLEHQLETKYINENPSKTVVLSQAERMFVNKNVPIKVAATGQWGNTAFFDGKDNYTGAIAELYMHISKETGLIFEFEHYKSYGEALGAVKSGKADMVAIFPYDFVFANEWDMQLSQKLDEISIYRVTNGSKTEGEIKSIALFGDPYLQKEIEKRYGSKIKYVEFNSVEAAVDAVLDGKADCTFLNYYTAASFRNQGKYLPLQYVMMPTMKVQFALGISANQNPLLKSIIAKGLRTVNSEYMNSFFQESIQDDSHRDLETQIYRNPKLALVMLALIGGGILIMLGAWFYTRQMRKKNAQLERAQRAQNDFLSRMSHDMRTPMNGILGLSYLMEKETSLNTVKGYIPELQEAGRYLLQLINDVLDVNKISSDNMSLNPKICDEEKVFAGIIDIIEPAMQEKQLTFNFEKINIVWTRMFLDEQRVKQIFINLLTNAVKFTPAGGHIDLIMELVEETEDKIVDKFVVRDNGIGMSKEFLPHLFEPFKQEGVINQDYAGGGTGLGLSIVKKLVELMNGSITVKSERGKGTEFTLFLTFPLAKKLEEKAASAALDAKDTKEEKVNSLRAKHLKPNLKILLCEDQPLNATIAQKLLSREGAEVTWAKDGAEGVEAFKAAEPNTFDVILMDIRMPVMDGLECTRTIRSLERAEAKTIPIIAMSANAYQEDIDKSLAAGMNAHLAKPIIPEEVYGVINKFVEETEQ